MNFWRLTREAPAGLALGGVTGIGGRRDEARFEAASAVGGAAGGLEGLAGEAAVAEHVEAAVPPRGQVDLDVDVGLDEEVDAAVFGRAVGSGDDGGRVDREFVAGQATSFGAGDAGPGSRPGGFVVAELNASAALRKQRANKEESGCGQTDQDAHETAIVHQQRALDELLDWLVSTMKA